MTCVRESFASGEKSRAILCIILPHQATKFDRPKNMPETWPMLFKRVRFAYSLSQQQLADKLSVDQTTISRWERGTITPEVRIQRTVRDMLRKHDPSLSVEGIALLPTAAALLYQDELTKVRAISAVAARAYGMTVQEALEADFEKIRPNCIVAACTEIMEHDAWKSGEAAGFEAVVRRGDGLWYRGIGLIIGPSNIVLWNGAPMPPPLNPHSDIVKWEVLTLDELVL